MDIIRERVKISPNICVQLYGGSYVDWAVYNSDEPLPFVPDNVMTDLKNRSTSSLFSYGSRKVKDKKNSAVVYCGAACFYSVPQGIHHIKGNRVLYRAVLPTSNKVIALWNPETKAYDLKESDPLPLLISKFNDYLNLLKEYRLLPDYIPNSPIGADGKADLLFDVTDYSLPQAYLYLCAARYVQEFPMVAWCITELIRNHGMNFYFAFTIAHVMRGTSLGHCVMELSGPYGRVLKEQAAFDLVSVDISHAFALAKFARNPEKYVKDKKLSDVKAGTAFSLQSTLRQIATTLFSVPNKLKYDIKDPYNYTYVEKTKVKLQDLFDEDLVAAVMSDDDKETLERFEKFQEKKITYVDTIVPVVKPKVKPVRKPRKAKAKVMEAV